MTDYPRFRYAQRKRGPYYDGPSIPAAPRARGGFKATMIGAVAVVLLLCILLGVFT